jgi:hypothetical protein
MRTPANSVVKEWLWLRFCSDHVSTRASRRAALTAFMLEEGLRFDIQTRIADLEARMQRKRGRR